jgi:lipid-A-disaccharide synthase
MNRKILVIAGDVSGDFYSSFLVKKLQEIDANIDIYAVGGNYLKNEKTIFLKDITKKSTIGFLEVLKNIPSLLFLKKKLEKLLDMKDFSAIICVDFQGFNMLIAKYAKNKGIKVIYFIPPQEWQWGTEKGMQHVVDNTDKIITIFQEEYDSYKKHTNNVRYFGHPLMQIIKDFPKKEIENKNNIAVFPGSRKQEIKYSFPVILRIIKKMHLKDKNQKFIINLPNKSFLRVVEKKISKMKSYMSIRVGKNYQTLAESKLALISSGSTALECLIMDVPHIVFYKFNFLSFLIINFFLRKKFIFKNYCLTNILARKEIVPEYLQKFDEKNILFQATEMLSDGKKVKNILDVFSQIRNKLNPKQREQIFEDIAKYVLE